MASIINASSTGSGGIVQTADASGVLQLQSNGTVALSISGAATTFGGNMLLEASGNPTMTVKTTGAGNNPLYRLQADTNYWDMLGVFSDANDTLRFRYNGSDKMVMNNGGIIALAGGDSDATGVGITFPSTQVASSNANTLDDYEEGSWTPACNFAGTSCTVDSVSARYVKIGRQVICSANFRITAKNAGSGAFELTGLPFACSGSAYNFGNCQGDTVSLGTASSMMPYVQNGTSTSRVLSQSPTGHTDINNTNVNNGCSMYFMLVYTTAT